MFEALPKPVYQGPVAVLFHPNEDQCLNAKETRWILLTTQRIEDTTFEKYHHILTRRPLAHAPDHRVVQLIDEGAHHYFKAWQYDDLLEKGVIGSAPKLMDQHTRNLYDGTLKMDESEAAPWIAEAYQPWIALHNDEYTTVEEEKNILGIKPQDFVTQLALHGVDHKPLVGMSSQDLRLAFLDCSAWDVYSRRPYKTIDLRSHQVSFFAHEIGRPELVIGGSQKAELTLT